MIIRPRSLALVSGCALGLSAPALAQPQFFPIPGGCYDVNNGGTVVVGTTGVGAFRWVRSGNTVTYTLLPDTVGTGLARCSADGSVVTAEMFNGEDGSWNNGLPPDAAISGRWTAGSGFVSLGVFTTNPPFPASFGQTINTPYDISDNGNVVVGLAYVPGGGFNSARAFRADFAAGTLISLGHTGGEGSRANCVSADGLVVGGWDRSPTTSIDLPAVWRIDPGTGTVTPFVLAGPDDVGEIGGCNADGSQLAGASSQFPGQLVRWTWNGSAYLPEPLGTIDDGFVSVTGMSNDGTVIVGSTGGFFSQEAFIWTPATGMTRLRDYLTERGITGLPDDASLSAVLSISPDGRALTVGGFFATSGLILLDGGAPCLQPVALPGPSTTEVSRCNPSAFLNVSATGSGPFTFQWRKNGEPIAYGPTGTGSTIEPGFFSPGQLIIQNAGASDAGTYDCVISNACGSVVSDPIPLTARPADLYDTCDAPLEAGGTGVVALPMCGAYVHERPASCGGDTQSADVWIRYTPLETGDYRITTCDQPGFDTILSVYADCNGPELACSGDFCFSLASIERIHLTAGVPVLVRLAVGFGVPEEPVRVTFSTLPPPPANDACDGAEVIPGPGFVQFDNTYAGNDGDASCRFNSGKDLWYTFTAPESGRLTLSTCGAILDTVLSVYDSCGGAELACNDSLFVDGCFFQSRIEALGLQAGQAVKIRLAAAQPDGIGAGFMEVSFVPGLVCDADFDQSGTLDPDDLSDFIACYFEQPPCDRADFDGSGTPDPDDLADFIAAYFAGC